MTHSPYMVGIDIGGTHFRIGAVSATGEILRHQIGSSRQCLGLAEPVKALVECVKTFCRDTPGTAAGLCIGFPGTVSKDKSTVLSCPNLRGFDGVNIRAVMESELGLRCIVEHEVLLLLTNDLQALRLEPLNCVMAVYLGTGIGNALYIHGRLLEGKNGTSGELGHIPVPDSAAPCPCGNTGCIELLASGKRLEEIKAAIDPQAADFGTLFAKAEQYPEVERYLDHVACAIATEINILDPDCVLLGGGVLSIQHFPYNRLLQLVCAHTRKPLPAETLRFVRLEVDPLRGVRGAGLYGWQRLCCESP